MIKTTFLSLLALALTSCVALYDRAEVYTATQTIRLGEALIGIEFVPSNVESSVAVSAMVVGAAESRSRGPYRIAIYAVGPRGRFTRFTLTEVTMDTPDGRSWQVPERFLNHEEFFLPSRDRKYMQATCMLKPLLDLNFSQFDEIHVKAGVFLESASGKSEKHNVQFTCTRQRRKSLQSHFIPTEVFQSIRMNDVPLEHMEVGAHRMGWKAVQ